MRRFRTFVLVAVVAVLASACDTGWLQAGYGPDRRSFNPKYSRLTTADVDQLEEAYRLPAAASSAPVVASDVVVALDAGAGSSTVRGYDAATGAE